jgi:hypothetical protein
VLTHGGGKGAAAAADAKGAAGGSSRIEGDDGCVFSSSRNVTTVEAPYRPPNKTMVADQVTCISCTSGNCTPFGGYYTVHIGSTQHTTGYMYANTGPIRDGINRVGKAPYKVLFHIR